MAPSATLIVLDTNVVLDWLLFGDPSSLALSGAVVGGRVRWIATAAMRAELAAVLVRGLAEVRCVDANALLARFDVHAELRADPATPSRALRLICSDPDDQKFLDLASAAGARWLLSRDRAVLRLARKALDSGLQILAPERWSPGLA